MKNTDMKTMTKNIVRERFEHDFLSVFFMKKALVTKEALEVLVSFF